MGGDLAKVHSGFVTHAGILYNSATDKEGGGILHRGLESVRDEYGECSVSSVTFTVSPRCLFSKKNIYCCVRLQ